MAEIKERICDICNEIVVTDYDSLVLKQRDKPIIYNGHKDCIRRKKEELGGVERARGITPRRNTRDDRRNPEVVLPDDPICKPLSPNAPTLTGNRPSKPHILDREIDDWFPNEIGMMCRVLSDDIIERYRKYGWLKDDIDDD